MPKAFSYLRFSTPEQIKGDSVRRQLEGARSYAVAHNLELDQELTFRDLGVSAYRGRNAEEGRLGDFKEAVAKGHVPINSYLLVESLDRLSRQTARKALRVLEDIVDLGITVVTLVDRKEYTKKILDEDPMALMMSLLIFIRANEESVTKSNRVRAAYDAKRERLHTEDKPVKPFTRRLPAWLHWNNTLGQFELIEERAEIVREIFQKADDGVGQLSIARKLNETGVTPFHGGRQWHRSYVAKVLSNPAVVGTFIPRVREHQAGKILRRPMEPRVGYWPAVVAPDVFERVSNRLSTKVAKGRHSGTEVKSLVAGLARCGHCGGSMTKLSKRNRDYLVCSAANVSAGCKYQTLWLESVQDALTSNAEAIYQEAPRGGEAEVYEEPILELEYELDELRDKATALTDEFVATKSLMIRKRLDELDAKGRETVEKIRELEDLKIRAGSPFVRERLTVMRDALLAEPLDLAAANRALREVSSAIVIHPEEGRLDIHWHHGGETLGIPVHSRHYRPFEAEPNGFSYSKKDSDIR